MRLRIFIIISITLITTNCLLSQNKTKNFNQQDLKAYQVDSGIYNFRFYDGDAGNKRGYPKGDTLAYFTDEKKYKGLINYGVKCLALDKRNCILEEDVVMYSLNAKIDSFEFNSEDSIVTVRGEIKKSWSKDDHIIWNNDGWVDNNSVNVFVGEKKDTISKLYYEPWLQGANKKVFAYTHNGEEFKDYTVLDSFPSFYLENYVRYKTKKGNNRPFEIKAKINPKSILIFGLKYSYSEIFEIGKLVFDKKEVRTKRLEQYSLEKPLIKSYEDDFKYIIRNNIQELYKDTITKPDKPWYYDVVETAERYIIKKQYSKANVEYQKLVQKEHYIFARDMHNAVRVAIIARDYNAAILWCEKLALKGVSIDYFKAKIFKRLKTNKQWATFYSKFPELHNQFNEGINLVLKTKLKEIVALDVKDYLAHSKGEFESSKLKRTTQKTDGELIKLIENEGFPTEEKIGVELTNDTIIDVKPNYYVLIYHSHQVNSNRNDEIRSIIMNSAKKFEYDNFRSGLDGFVNIGTCFMLYKGNLYNEKNCVIYKEDLLRMKFILKNKYGFIIDESDLSELAFSKKNELDDDEFMKDNFIFIEKVRDKWIIEE